MEGKLVGKRALLYYKTDYDLPFNFLITRVILSNVYMGVTLGTPISMAKPINFSTSSSSEMSPIF